MNENIVVGGLYEMESPVKKQEIIVEIISTGNRYILIDIFVKGKKTKRRRHIDKMNTGFIFKENELILNPSEFVSNISCKNLKDRIINDWRKGNYWYE